MLRKVLTVDTLVHCISGQTFISWLWVGHYCPPMHEWIAKTVLLPYTMPISGREAFSWSGQVLAGRELRLLQAYQWVGVVWREHVEDGCKSTCVKFGGWKPGYGKFNA